MTAGYSLWMMTFQTDKNILVIATKQDTAKNLVTKIRVMHANLPSWVRSSCVEDNKLSLRYSNGSQVKAISSTEDAGRSEALSLLVIDEAAFIDKIDTIWTAQSTLSTGGQCIHIHQMVLVIGFTDLGVQEGEMIGMIRFIGLILKENKIGEMKRQVIRNVLK